MDLRILDALQRRGDLTNKELAERVNLSPSQCSRRRARLEADGVITGYRAELDLGTLGFGMVVFIQVSLARHDRDNPHRFRDLLRFHPQVQEAHAMTGDSDYQIKVIIGSLEELRQLINDVLLPHEAVSHVRSSVALETLVEKGHLPIEV